MKVIFIQKKQEFVASNNILLGSSMFAYFLYL